MQTSSSIEKPVPSVRRVYPPIECRPNLSREELADGFMAQNKPVVIPTQSAAWCARWEPEALRARYGHCEIDAEETKEVYVGERSLVRKSIASVVDATLSGDTNLRWKGLEFLSKVPGIREDLEMNPPPFRPLLPHSIQKARSTLWIAPKGTMSSLHHDGNFDNLNLQISGKKLFLLIPPPQHRQLHFYGSAESPINPFVPDFKRFPGFADATPLEATLHPGDTLLIPKYWWHCVYVIEPAVNLACCFSWDKEPSAWRTLEGAPWAHRMLTVASAEMKRHGLVQLANTSRRLWWATYARMVPRIVPQARGELVDPPVP